MGALEVFEYFPKISYKFGDTEKVMTNIFKSITVTLDDAVKTNKTKLKFAERPDQLANRLFQNSNYIWSIFLCNNIRNPITYWNSSETNFIEKIENNYSNWVYQFVNNSDYIPGNTFYYDEITRNSYTGVDLSGISSDDLIIYETGQGSFSINSIGAGITLSSDTCGKPQYGQSIIPDNFNKQDSVIDISCGNYYTACLDSSGNIYIWGKPLVNIGDNFMKGGNLWTSKSSGYTYISGTGEDLVVITSSGGATCFGGCTGFKANYVTGNTALEKISWLKNGLCGGVGIYTDKSVQYYGNAGPSGLTFQDISCGFSFCAGIIGNTRGVTVWGNNAYNQMTNCPSSVGWSTLSSGNNHIVVASSSGITAWGDNSSNQCDVENFHSSISVVSAGLNHTTAIHQGGIDLAGSVTIYDGGSGCCGATENINVSTKGLTGTFSNIASGLHHIPFQQSGTNVKYIGVIDSVDDIYKRIITKTTQFTNNDPVLLNDVSSTIVSFWRINPTTGQYGQIKQIQNQLIGIQKYLDSALYLKTDDSVLDITDNTVWNDIFIPNLTTPQTDVRFITLRKELLTNNFYEKFNINFLNRTNTDILKNKIRSSILTNDIIEIKTSTL